MKTILYNLHDPQYQSETYKCFYCGAIVKDNEKCECQKVENPNDKLDEFVDEYKEVCH
jgi:hypothetical protein